MPTLTRTVTGLLLQDAFASSAGWTAGSGFSNLANTLLLTFGRHPSPMLADGGNPSADYDGVREPQLYIESANLWAMIYDGGDDTNGWRIFLATSTDRGLTWTKQGALGPAVSNGSGGSVSAAATGWIEKRGSTYYLHRAIANATFASPNVGLPAPPYTGDTWSTTSAPGAAWTVLANWTFVRAFGPGTGWAANELLPCSMYFDGATYHMFVEGQGGAGYKAGRQSSSSPGGPWTLDATPQFSAADFQSRPPENGKVFYHPTLSLFAQLLNLIETGGNFTDRNAVCLSASVTNWAGAAKIMTQRYYSPNVTDSARALGVACHVTQADGVLQHENGYVPFLFDADPGASSPGWHRHRRVRSSVYEPTATTLRYSDAGGTRNRYSKAIANSDFEVEFAIGYAAVGAGGDVSFEYRSNGTTGYRLRIPATFGALMTLERMDGTLIDNGAAGVAGVEDSVFMYVRLRVSTVAGNTTHTAWLDGSQNMSVVDNTYASGTQIAFSAKTITADIALFNMRTGPTLTVRGLAAAQTIVLRSHGEMPVASITADGSGVATYAGEHWPLSRVQIGGADFQTGDKLLWGGDDLTYSSGAAVLAAAAASVSAATAALTGGSTPAGRSVSASGCPVFG